jgi:hypothetical protein
LTDEPATIVTAITKPVDIFFSTAVFQHFPSKDYAIEVLKAIRAVCAETAIGFIHIRFDNGTRRYRGIRDIKDYDKQHIRATSFPLDEFWTILSETGFVPLAVTDIRTLNNSAVFFMRRGAGASEADDSE